MDPFAQSANLHCIGCNKCPFGQTGMVVELALVELDYGLTGIGELKLSERS